MGPIFAKWIKDREALRRDTKTQNTCQVNIGGTNHIKRFKVGVGLCAMNDKGQVDLNYAHLYCASSSTAPKKEMPVRACKTANNGLIMVKHVRESPVTFSPPNGVPESISLSFIKIAVCAPPTQGKNKPRSCSIQKIIYKCVYNDDKEKCKPDA